MAETLAGRGELDHLSLLYYRGAWERWLDEVLNVARPSTFDSGFQFSAIGPLCRDVTELR